MGRWKQGPNGPYFDPNDSGPNQVAPPGGPQPSQAPQAQATQNAVAGNQTTAQGGLSAPQIQAQAAQRAVASGQMAAPAGADHDDHQPAAGQPQTPPQVMHGAQIQNYYRQYLGRDASEAELRTHANNPHGMAGVEQTIRGSQEAANRRGQTAPQIDPEATGDQQIQAYYRHYLGRDASAQEIQTHLRNPYGMHAVHETIRGSQEAAARAQGAQGASGASGAPPQFGAGVNFDGFNAPQHVAANPGAAPPGWDANKWNDPNHQTPKYVVGRILSQFPTTVEGATQAAAEIARAYPGTTFNGKDKLTIPGVGTFDILRGASVGGQGFQFNQLSGPNGEPVDGGGGGRGPTGLGGFNPAAPNMNQFSNEWLVNFLRSMGVGL